MTNDTLFRERVYSLAKTIPAGNVATYGQLAEMVGSKGAARAVGVCMKENPDNTVIPCHRVVAADGSLTGYAFGGVLVKKEKLMLEGVHFVGDKVDLKK